MLGTSPVKQPSKVGVSYIVWKAIITVEMVGLNEVKQLYVP